MYLDRHRKFLEDLRQAANDGVDICLEGIELSKKMEVNCTPEIVAQLEWIKSAKEELKRVDAELERRRKLKEQGQRKT